VAGAGWVRPGRPPAAHSALGGPLGVPTWIGGVTGPWGAGACALAG
jgi:hypothetical protein